jgi:hypothetical protein
VCGGAHPRTVFVGCHCTSSVGLKVGEERSLCVGGGLRGDSFDFDREKFSGGTFHAGYKSHRARAARGRCKPLMSNLAPVLHIGVTILDGGSPCNPLGVDLLCSVVSCVRGAHGAEISRTGVVSTGAHISTNTRVLP